MKKTLLLILLLLPASLFADSIQYTFTTIGGTTGSFTLDSAPFVIKTQGLWGYGYFPPTPFTYYYSAATFISGTYGDYSLSWTDSGFAPSFVGLHIDDMQPPYDSALDQLQGDDWMLRANVTSNMFNGRHATTFSILDYAMPSALNGPTFAPPPPNQGMKTDLILVGFSDGSFDQGELASLTMAQPIALASITNVPEPPTWVTMGIGLAILGVLVLRDGKKRKAS